MNAVRVMRLKETDLDGDLIEIIVWKVPASFDNPDGLRYRMAFIPLGERSPAVLYDNHHPKGHHKHIRGKEFPYRFENIDQLLKDFGADVQEWKRNNKP